MTSFRYRGSIAPTPGLRTPVLAMAPDGSGVGTNGVAVLRLYDPIDAWGGDWGVSAKEFAAALDTIPDASEIRLHLNSPGGDVFDGIAIMNQLREHPATLGAEGTTFTATFGTEHARIFSPLIGRFNVYNCLAALSVGLTQGRSLQEMSVRLAHFKNARGRLERVDNPRGLNVFVDYAHTHDALENVLKTLLEIKKGRLITVFGCGGDRDKSKRPKMGRVAEKLSDISIITADNPRSEDPEKIAQEILVGYADPTHAITVIDRRSAITKALSLAGPNDIILIAGKGHETKQIFAHKTYDFDDRKVVLEQSY